MKYKYQNTSSALWKDPAADRLHCIFGCCNKEKPVAPELSAESVKAVLLEEPEMLFEALQKGEEKRQEEMRRASQKLIGENIEDINKDNIIGY